jgi:iron complex transport system substrate-binding protein
MSPRQGRFARSAAVLALTCVVAAGAGAAAGAASSAPATEEQARAGPDASLQAKAEAANTREVIDEVGRHVRVPLFPERIVSLAPNLTETLYALGVEDRLVGVTNYSDHPAAARAKPHIGQPMNPSLEEIAALHPDLVLATPTINREETVEALARLGLAVYVTDPHSIEELLGSIESLAALVGAPAAGTKLAAELRARLERLRDHLAGRPAKRALFVVWEDPLITAGQSSFIADALAWAGGESVVRSREPWPHISFEEVVALDPGALVFASAHSGKEKKIAAELARRPGWRDLRAVREGHIIVVSDAINRPGPCLVGAIEELARALHPEAFAETAPGAAPAPQEEALCR